MRGRLLESGRFTAQVSESANEIEQAALTNGGLQLRASVHLRPKRQNATGSVTRATQ